MPGANFQKSLQSCAGSRSRGFTLIEMAVLLVVTGFIIATVLPRIISGTKKDLMIEGKRIVRTAREEVLGFYVTNKKLPTSSEFTTSIGHRIGRRKSKLVYHYSNDFDLNATLPDGKNPGPIAFWVVSSGENHAFEDADSYNSSDIAISYYDENGFDDIVDFVTKDYLESLTTEDNSSGSDDSGVTISFENNMSDFEDRIQQTDEDDPVVSVDSAAGTVTMHIASGGKDHNDSGCIWYNGDGNGTCPDGICPFNSTLRAYFTLTWNHQGGGLGGIVFAVITAINNDNPCGGDLQSEMGYSGEFPESLTDSSNSYIDSPKYGLELDTQKDTSNNDPANNHVAHIYWATDSHFDDCVHGAGAGSDGENPGTAGDGVYWDNGTWLENADKYSVRLEMKKTTDDQTTETKAWIVPTSSVASDTAFSDVQNDYTDLNVTIYDQQQFLNVTNWTKFQNIRFGWTVGAKNKYDVEISNFAISIQ